VIIKGSENYRERERDGGDEERRETLTSL